MQKAFFKGGSDTHRTEVLGRLVAFSRADDEALPYALVSPDEAAVLAQSPSLYLVPEAAPVTEAAPRPARTPRTRRQEA